jgi:hypothetical protein
MDVCLHLSVLCCPVSVEALCWTDPPTKESYQMSIGSGNPLRKAKGPHNKDCRKPKEKKKNRGDREMNSPTVVPACRKRTGPPSLQGI